MRRDYLYAEMLLQGLRVRDRRTAIERIIDERRTNGLP